MTAIRSYIAGTGAASALLGAAVVSFALLTALVAFEGFTIGGGAAGSDTVSIARGSELAGTDAVAVPGALAVSAAAGAVAPAPVVPAVLAPATTAGTDGGTTPIVPTGTPVPTGPGAPVVPPGSPGIPSPGPAVDGGNPVDNVVGGIDQTINEATGIPSDLGGVVEPVTDVLDQLSTGLTGQDLGTNLNNLGLTNPMSGKPLIGEQGEGIAGTGLLP